MYCTAKKKKAELESVNDCGGGLFGLGFPLLFVASLTHKEEGVALRVFRFAPLSFTALHAGTTHRPSTILSAQRRLAFVRAFSPRFPLPFLSLH